jgi:hypothetical protein
MLRRARVSISLKLVRIFRVCIELYFDARVCLFKFVGTSWPNECMRCFVRLVGPLRELMYS